MWLHCGIGERREWFQPSKRKCHVEGGEGKKRISKAIMMGVGGRRCVVMPNRTGVEPAQWKWDSARPQWNNEFGVQCHHKPIPSTNPTMPSVNPPATLNPPAREEGGSYMVATTTVVLSSVVELLVPTLLVVVGGLVITAGAMTVVEVEVVAVIVSTTEVEEEETESMADDDDDIEVAGADAAEVR